jgi:hypothetical protein
MIVLSGMLETAGPISSMNNKFYLVTTNMFLEVIEQILTFTLLE